MQNSRQQLVRYYLEAFTFIIYKFYDIFM